MPQKKKKDVKKEVKKVVKNVIKNSKQQPLLKNSINIKIDLDDDEKKKKPKRKKRQDLKKEQTDNNVSYVDELGKPISNEILNNRSFSSSYMPQPFSRNSTVIGTSFNESAIMDKVIEKISKLNTSNQSMNQSMNNSVLNQSTTAPPQLPRPARAFPAPSTIVPASPSVAPQSLNFNLTSQVRPVGLTPLQASSLALNPVQQYVLASQSAATVSQDAIFKVFEKVQDPMDQAEIKKTTVEVKNKYNVDLMSAAAGGARAARFKMHFMAEYKGNMFPRDAAEVAYKYFILLP